MEPLPPVKEVEYRCYVGKIFEELSGAEFITFAFETAKEFSSFRYEIAVRYRIQPNLLEFKVLGMTATRTMMPAHGTARSVLKLPMLPYGVYGVKMIKSDGTENIFSIEINKKGITILPPVPRKRFLDLIVENKAASPGAKIVSTISKTPPPPLIPRTIQKRQPPPPTPEELAILEALRSETPEERDAREEAELFGGGSKKIDKTELKELGVDAKNAKASAAAKPPTNGKHESAKHDAKYDVKHDAKHDVKHDAKHDVKHDAKHDAKHAPKPDAKHASKPVAKPAQAKPAAKPAPAKSKATAKTGKTKTAATTVTRHAATKHSAKQAPAKKAAPAAKHAVKKTTKSAPAKTGSARTAKSPAHGKKPVAKKR
jgi:hypothetical protein